MAKRIEIKGPIIPSDYQWIYDLFEMEATSPKKINDLIAEAEGEDLDIIINSGGGDVFSGSEIYTTLKDYPRDVTVKIVGVAASAASVIAMSGKRILMSPTAQIMIHNASTVTWGDKQEHRESAKFLQKIDESIANSYQLKTGMSREELLALMNKETWMNAQDALDRGFIDEIMFEGEQLRAVASVGNEMIPEKVIERIRNEFSKLKMKGAENMGSTNHQQVQNNNQAQAATTAPANANQNPQTDTQASGNGADLVAQERERIMAIMEISNQIDHELVNEAIESGMTAAELSLKAMKEGKMVNNGLFQQAVAANKAAGTDNVQAQGQEQSQEKEYNLNNLKDINAIFAQLANSSMAGRQQNIKRG